MRPILSPARPIACRIPRTRRTVSAALAAGLALAVLLAGCTSDGPAITAGNKPTNGTAQTPGTAEVVESDPDAGLKKGSQLKAALPTAKDAPAGFKVERDMLRDSVDGFAEAVPAAPLKRSSCKELDTSLWTSGSGIESASFAQTSFTDRQSNQIYAMIESYRGNDAETAMTNLRKLFRLCARYRTTLDGVGRVTVKLVIKAGPKVGDGSIRAVQTSPELAGGVTLIATRSGNEIVSVLVSAIKNDGGVQGAKLTRLMIRRLTQSQ
jgi:hypothetical protein